MRLPYRRANRELKEVLWVIAFFALEATLAEKTVSMLLTMLANCGGWTHVSRQVLEEYARKHGLDMEELVVRAGNAMVAKYQEMKESA
jgi:hypothetical protein